MRKTLCGAACAMLVAALAPAASGASLRDMPRPLQRKVACMVHVLKATPGIDRIKVLVWDGESGFQYDDPTKNGSWLHPILEYRVRDPSGERQVLRYETQRPSESGSDDYWFLTTLNGLSGLGDAPPSEWRTEEIALKWQARCGVRAGAIFE